MHVWRLSNHADLSGRGGLLAGGRWHSKGTPIVYCADHPASCLLEMLVHVDIADRPTTYQLLMIDFPDGTGIEDVSLPSDWRQDVSLTRSMGSRFIAKGELPVLRVPSAIIPFSTNYLLNPALLAGAGIRIVGVSRHPVDDRLNGAG
jgi:RES domain-containing protein